MTHYLSDPTNMGGMPALYPLTVDNKKCMIELLSTSGSDEYHAIRDSLFLEFDGCILMYSLTSRASFENVRELWLRARAVRGEKSGLRIFVLGNQTDLRGEREVGFEEGEQLARALGCGFCERSDFEGRDGGVEVPIRWLVQQIEGDEVQRCKNQARGKEVEKIEGTKARKCWWKKGFLHR